MTPSREVAPAATPSPPSTSSTPVEEAHGAANGAAYRPETRRARRARWVPAVVVAVVAVLAVGGAALGLGVIPRGGAGQALGPPRFEEATATAGLDHTYDGPLAYFAGGGVAVLDCDDDGRPDLYVAGGVDPAALFRNESTPGNVRFEPVPDAATDLTFVTGAYPLDIDGDGHVDLAVLRNGENVLLRGTGDCKFDRANEAWTFDGGDAPTMAFSATWEGDAKLPTLAFGNYVDPASTDPHRLCADNVLVRPAPSGTGYAKPIPLSPSFCALSMLFSDWDRSGRRDLRISNDAHYYMDGEEQLWRIEPGSPPREYTAADGWVKVNVEGMGIASQDLTGDGLPEVYLTSQGENRLQALIDGAGRPAYGDIGLKRNVNAARPFVGDTDLPSTAWHPEFDDVNDDGFIDLFVSKGNVMSQPDFAMRDPSNLLIGQTDGTFVEGAEAAGIVAFDRGRGAALTDLDLDGRLDLVEVNLSGPTRVWRNTGVIAGSSDRPLGHWTALRLRQPGPNRDAIGAWLETRIGSTVQQRELTVGGGHGGGELGWTHVGLGAAQQADVRVQWPDGTVGPWMAAPVDGFGIIERGADAVTPWAP